MIWKKKTPSITLSTFDPYLLKNLPPIKGSAAIPDWFKETPGFNGDGSISDNFTPLRAPTLRRCPALNDFFLSGIVIPLWTDLEFYVDSKAKRIEWRYSNNYDGIEMIQPHPPEQYPTIAHKYLHAKIISPWIADCTHDFKWYMTKPSYMTSEFEDQDVVFLDGVLNYKNNFTTNVNLFFPVRDSSYTVKFSANKPFQKLIPLTEQSINMSVSYCTREYYTNASLFGRRISYYLGKFYNSMKKK